NADRHFLWGLRYIDDLILRDRDTTGDGSLDEPLYALQDANWNVSCLVDTGGEPAERYIYDAYGTAALLTPSFSVRGSTIYPWETLFCGYRWEREAVGYMVRSRNLACHLGRWTRRDPALPIDGISRYEYVHSNPLRSVDYLGLWGKDIHYEFTKKMAITCGTTAQAAEAIGKADDAVDYGSTSPIPPWGEQAYHFDRSDRSLPNPVDSRDALHKRHFDKAKAECCFGPPWWRDNPEVAAEELGTSLHPHQDWVAHGDYGKIMTRIDASYARHHNKRSPQRLAGFGPPEKYPDIIDLDAINGPRGRPAGAAIRVITDSQGRSSDYAEYRPGRQRKVLNRERTAAVLRQFLNHVLLKGGPKCKKYFLAGKRVPSPCR
ncbi:MAG TPA: hypothetical protein EYP14_05275, partial [Planctomycetaceae bacterium]|nr:hypothetical protein [Planctomycetaceae bacterium]